jgi:hypothetical protein
MKINTALKLSNPFLVVMFISQAVTALFHDNLPYKSFQLFHKGGGYVLLGLILLHIFLNYRWFKRSYFTRRPGDM